MHLGQAQYVAVKGKWAYGVLLHWREAAAVSSDCKKVETDLFRYGTVTLKVEVIVKTKQKNSGGLMEISVGLLCRHRV